MNNKYDVMVIGGGPAGMMAAARAGELGARVLLLEKNQRLGIKLLITGNGRCNVTNDITAKEFISTIGTNGKFLSSGLHMFGPQTVMSFFEGRGVKLKTEDHDRVFPASNKGLDVLAGLQSYLVASKVEIMYGADVIKLNKSNTHIESVSLSNGTTIKADKFIVTTGGKSYPNTGSTGNGYIWAKKLGHEIITLRPGLAAIDIEEKWVSSLEGISLKNVEISAWKNEKRLMKKTGDLIFTKTGVSGPVIHDISLLISGEVDFSRVKLTLNLLPSVEQEKINLYLQDMFNRDGNKHLINGVSRILPERLADIVLKHARTSPDKKQSEVNKEERSKLAEILGGFRLHVAGVANFDKANVTAGGVSLVEVDPKTMKSKIVNNLYFAGEILDLAGPTGGFNLQICWSTGYLAGQAAAD